MPQIEKEKRRTPICGNTDKSRHFKQSQEFSSSVLTWLRRALTTPLYSIYHNMDYNMCQAKKIM